MQIFASYLPTPIGIVEIKANTFNILSISFLEELSVNNNFTTNSISEIGKQQLQAYFKKDSVTFDLPLQLNGTNFQNKVWTALQDIPYGKTTFYEQFAINLGDAKCIRAAASANGKNPFAIVVPCHRVIGKNGLLTGYAGGLWRKQWLLEHEGVLQKQKRLF